MSSSTKCQQTIGFWIKRKYRYFLTLISFSGNIHMMGYLNLPSRVYLTDFFFLLLSEMCSQTLSEMNKVSHGKQTEVARSGPRSFAQPANIMVRNALYNNQQGF